MEFQAADKPDKIALICGGHQLSWSELWQKTQTAAAVLSSRLSAREQQVVAILAPNSVEFVVAYLAVVHAGHIALPIDVTFKKLEIDSVLDAVAPELTIAHKKMLNLAGKRALAIDDLTADNRKPGKFLRRLPPDRQIATLFLSSGTTGKPKAIPNTHTNQIWDVQAIAGPMGWTADDTVLITLPLSHRHGLVICLLSAIYHGNTVHLEARFDAAKTLAMLESGKISLYSAVPTIYKTLAEYQPETVFDLTPVRLLASSSSALPPYLRQAIKERFKKDIMDRYGTSETGSIAIRSSESQDSFDNLLEGVRIKIEPSGEVALQSHGLFPGYYKNQAATKENMTENGWWLTGDIGEFHNGRLTLKGRSKERIQRSGYSLYPQDIEWALSQHSQVKEVKVIGFDVAGSLDSGVVAFYTGDASEQSLRQYSKVNLPRSWRPDFYIKLAALPKTHTGKTSLASLNKLLKEEHAHLGHGAGA